jgi:Dolichyl-phosphate-mannose-protein mannosyltransferase
VRALGERATMLAVLGAAGVACVLGAADPPSAAPGGTGKEALDLIRIGCTSALAIALLLGPGILWRALGNGRIRLGFLFLPGLGLLAATGGLAWLLAGSVEPKLVCFAVFGPVLGLMLGALIGSEQGDLLDPEERRVLLYVSLVLAVAIGRSMWSLGTTGELFEGTISRNLVAEPRPDSQTSYFLAELIAHGKGPYSDAAGELFGPSPYNFATRGPLPGLASAPIVFLSGGQPQLGIPDSPWRPFDPQGFMAYRLAMIVFSCTVLVSLWELVRRLGGDRAARLALLLGVSTPFVFADLWFTWPKLLAASFALLGGLCVLERRPLRGGLSVGVGYLMHPSALLSLSAIGPLALWPPRRGQRWPRWRRPELRPALLVLLGGAVCFIAWRLLNGSHFSQGGFFEYFLQAYPSEHPSIGEWIDFRLTSLADTLVPLYLPLFEAHSVSINTFGGISPGVVHFFFQYWTGVPFGFAIVFFPLLVISLWRALRRWPWPVTAAVIAPFVLFLLYWGASITGILREGFQWWPFAVLAVIALQQGAEGFPWLRSRLLRGVLALRGVEVFAVAVGPVLGTQGFRILGDSLALNDLVAFGTILAACAALVALVWSETGRLAAQTETGRAAGGGDGSGSEEERSGRSTIAANPARQAAARTAFKAE